MTSALKRIIAATAVLIPAVIAIDVTITLLPDRASCERAPNEVEDAPISPVLDKHASVTDRE